MSGPRAPRRIPLTAGVHHPSEHPRPHMQKYLHTLLIDKQQMGAVRDKLVDIVKSSAVKEPDFSTIIRATKEQMMDTNHRRER